MIARLEGVLREKRPTAVLVDVGGVGYEVFVPLSTFDALPDEGKVVALRIHTHVREDALQLFGFASELERRLFELLIRTSGVGPRLAQTILSGMAPADLMAALRAGDVAALRAVPGLGAKKAERLVVELRDRLDELEPGPGVGAARSRTAGSDPLADQALSALQNLGYPGPQAERLVDRARAELGAEARLEDLLRRALRGAAR